MLDNCYLDDGFDENILHAALKNAIIPLLHETFNIFKARTERISNYFKNPNQTESTPSSDVITETRNTPQVESEHTPQEQSVQSVKN